MRMGCLHFDLKTGLSAFSHAALIGGPSKEGHGVSEGFLSERSGFQLPKGS